LELILKNWKKECFAKSDRDSRIRVHHQYDENMCIFIENKILFSALINPQGTAAVSKCSYKVQSALQIYYGFTAAPIPKAECSV